MAAGDSPPAFSTDGYPLQGDRLGSAWRMLWLSLEDGKWHSGTALSKSIAVEVTDSTIRGLLNRATYAGLLEKRVCQYNSKKTSSRVQYRRPDVEK